MAQWRTIPGWPAHVVSDDGQVWSSKHGLLTGWLNPNGYQIVTIGCSGRKWNAPIGVLVLTVFVGPGNGLECCHNNNDKTDNRVDNLRWDTRGGNVADAMYAGTHHAAKLGDGHNGTIIPDAIAWEIANKTSWARGEAAALARSLGVSFWTVNKIKNGQVRTHLIGAPKP